MLMHEWIKYRQRQIKKASSEAEVSGEERAQQAEEDAAVEPRQSRRLADARQLAAALAERSPESARQRLQAIVGRQRRLPIEIEEADGAEAKEREKAGGRLTETREQLIQRLLDPTLTLQETATLLGVCTTTVRRYTNRGVLRCFRTPGNQRRFRLSDVLDFMEHRQEGEI